MALVYGSAMVFLTTLWYTVWFKVRITGENLQCGKAITVWGRFHSERFTEERTHGYTVKNTVFHRVNTLSDSVKLEHFHSVVALQSHCGQCSGHSVNNE